ncbi:unnamed protein product [Brachionus calyciflorus]|uniref:Uncharacterized protein n=1 Tax=Brachionus calyciflorus TaxID=104777 RepID=A0A814NTU8_9BILA|nr:unnamed protein product [Brachionus calyciflorus]
MEKISKNEILNHYDKLISNIDIYSERILSKQYLSDDVKLSLNQERDLIISKIKQIEKLNLTCLNFEPFCFFLSNDLLKENPKTKSCLQNKIGKLIILKTPIDEDLLKEIKRFIIKSREPNDYFFDSFSEALKYDIILKLIENRFNDTIIDLSNPELNSFKTLELSDDSGRFKRIKLKHIEFLKLFLNTSSVEILQFKIDEMYPFPNYLSLFPNLKTLEVAQAYWRFIPSYGFSCLEQLEILIFEDTPIKFILDDAFKGLKNLKKLSIKESSIDIFNSDTFQDLESLEELTLINKYKIEGLDLNCLTSLKHLDLNGRHNRLVLDSNFLKNCCNLTVINLEDSFINHIPSDIFQSIKCLKYLNVSNEKCLSNDEQLLIDYEFLKPLNNLEYLKVTVNDNLFNCFNQVKLPSLKFLWMSCKLVQVLENNFENLVTLKIDGIEKLDTGCFNKLNGLKNLILYFRVTENLVDIDSKYFTCLDNLDYLKTKGHYRAFYNYIKEKDDYFMQMFDKSKILEKDYGTYFLTVSNKDIEMDLYSGLSDETKEELLNYISD